MTLHPRVPRLTLTDGVATRMRAVTGSLDRMVQVQNGRLVVNWIRAPKAAYPRYSTTFSELQKVLADWIPFARASGLGEVEFEQWEVTYVNQIPQAELWSSGSDVASLLPGLFGPTSQHVDGVLESSEGVWRVELPGRTGRLHIDVKQGWPAGAGPVDPQVLLLQLTARGPAGDLEALYEGMNVGHIAIVETFARITGPAAHKAWKRVDGY